ncbi:ATP-binding protein [Vulcanisaeta distributa]|uniref:ATP-binding protein n=1 Tax=Vulcanisaeta distributa TaxID=164451 RepID=UPI0006D02E1F|nr:ATP-binding protein [Vulcanisaeta distributa]
MRRIKLKFAGREVEFVDRDLALRLVEEWAERGGTYPPVQVIYGPPEGCGKTAWLLQAVELLKDYGFNVIYINPINRLALAEVSTDNIREEFLNLIKEAINQNALAKVAWIAYNVAYDLIKATRGKIAVIVDDAFQAIGIKESALYVKALLNLIEYPPEHYEKIVTVAATSEGVSLREIGRHRWAWSTPMWNMPKDSFEQLYDQIPSNKPPFEEAWRITGGNPAMLESLHRVNWNVDKIVSMLIKEKDLSYGFVKKWLIHLREAINDPDYLWFNAPEELVNELIERNLILYFLPKRDPEQWVDQPPPEKDLELGIGKYVAWQTPLHREAVKRALESVGE